MKQAEEKKIVRRASAGKGSKAATPSQKQPEKSAKQDQPPRPFEKTVHQLDGPGGKDQGL